MTDVGARGVISPGDPLREPSFQDDVEAAAAEMDDFEALWSEVTTSMNEIKYEEDPESRLTADNIAKAYAARLAFPDKVSVTRAPLGSDQDLDTHVRTHFETLVEQREELQTVLGWDEGDVLDACELIYVDDAVFRFVTVTEFEPTDDELATVRFNEYPDAATEWMIEWMERVDVLWGPLRGERALDETTDELLDELSESRDRFVRAAREADVFVPITDDVVPDPASARKNIKRRIRRGSPSSERIHRYCYTLVDDQL